MHVGVANEMTKLAQVVNGLDVIAWQGICLAQGFGRLRSMPERAFDKAAVHRANGHNVLAH